MENNGKNAKRSPLKTIKRPHVDDDGDEVFPEKDEQFDLIAHVLEDLTSTPPSQQQHQHQVNKTLKTRSGGSGGARRLMEEEHLESPSKKKQAKLSDSLLKKSSSSRSNSPSSSPNFNNIGEFLATLSPPPPLLQQQHSFSSSPSSPVKQIWNESDKQVQLNYETLMNDQDLTNFNTYFTPTNSVEFEVRTFTTKRQGGAEVEKKYPQIILSTQNDSGSVYTYSVKLNAIRPLIRALWDFHVLLERHVVKKNV